MSNPYDSIPTRVNNTTIDASWFNTIKTTLVNNGSVKHKNDATTAPSTTNDDSENFEAGSTWTDTTNDKFYACLDATTSNAIWREITFVEGAQTLTGAKTFSAPLTVSNTTESTDKDTGSVIIDGGVGIEKNLNVGGNTVISGNLTVQGDTTTVNTATLDIEDAQITLNKNGDQSVADANDSGIKTEMSDATDCLVHYDSTATSKWKCGESGSTKEIATLSDAQQLTNKDIDGGTASDSNRITLPKNTTSNLTGLTRKEGTLVYDTTTSKPYFDDGATLTEIGAGSGSGGINYIDNPDAEDGTTGWATFDDGGSYVDGTGGTASNLTFTPNTSSPLRGDGDFDLVVGAADASGEGVSYDFSIDNADKFQVLSISFDYKTNAPDDFFSVRIFDQTNSNIIYPTPQDVKANSNETKFVAQFQTTDSTSYRLSIFVNDTDATGYTINFDTVTVGPERAEIESIPVIFSAERSTTSQTITAGSNADIEFNNIREDSRNAYDGTDTYTFPESGYYKVSGTICCICGATAPNYIRVVLNSTNLVYQDDLTNGKAELIPYSYTKYFNQGDTAILKFYCDAQNVSLYTSGTNITIEKTGGVISGGGNDVVALIVERNDGQTMINNTIDVVEFNTVKADTAGVYNSSTGEATIPSSGYYQATAQVTFSSANLDVDEYIQTWVYKNGSALTNNATTLDSSDGGTPYKCSLISKLFYFEKGDVVDVRFRQNSGTDSATYVFDGLTFFTLHKVNSSEQVFSSEKIAARYKADSGTLTDATWTPFNFDTRDFDTHNAVTTGAGVWRFTSPVTGYYDAKFNVCTPATAFSAGQILWCRLKKNGTVISQIACHEFETSVTAQLTASLTDTVELIKGDYLEFEVYQNSGGNITVPADNAYNYCAITRL